MSIGSGENARELLRVVGLGKGPPVSAACERETIIISPFQAKPLQLPQLGLLPPPRPRPHAFIGHPLDTAAEEGAK